MYRMACPTQFLCRALRTVGLVLVYYVFSIGITFYNKWLMKVRYIVQLVENLNVLCFEKSTYFCPFVCVMSVFFLSASGLPLSSVHDAGSSRNHFQFLHTDTLCHAVLDGKASCDPSLEGLPF